MPTIRRLGADRKFIKEVTSVGVPNIMVGAPGTSGAAAKFSKKRVSPLAQTIARKKKSKSRGR